jgi:hypothetical protein
VLSFATLARPYRPLVTCVFALLLASPPLFFVLDPWVGLLAAAVLALLIFAFLGLGWLDARRRYARMHLATRVVLMTLNFLALGATLSATFTLLNVWASGFAWSNIVYTTVLGPLVCWLVVLPAGINAARQQILRDSERVNKQLRWELARANALVWQEQQELSTALHRDIQGTMLASAFRLKQVIETVEIPVRQLMRYAPSLTTASTACRSAADQTPCIMSFRNLSIDGREFSTSKAHTPEPHAPSLKRIVWSCGPSAILRASSPRTLSSTVGRTP